MNCFRRDLYLGRIRAFRMRWAEALAFYERVRATYAEAHPDEGRTEGEDGEKDGPFPEQANIYVEAAQAAERTEGGEKAPELYRRAYDLEIARGYEEDADRIRPKIGDPPQAPAQTPPQVPPSEEVADPTAEPAEEAERLFKCLFQLQSDFESNGWPTKQALECGHKSRFLTKVASFMRDSRRGSPISRPTSSTSCR
jgi:hypothetical protein